MGEADRDATRKAFSKPAAFVLLARGLTLKTDTAPRERRFERFAELAELSTKEFVRFIPDFIAWFAFAKEMQAAGAEPTAMIWVDDGRSGEISHANITIKETGETRTVYMPGFEPVEPGASA